MPTTNPPAEFSPAPIPEQHAELTDAKVLVLDAAAFVSSARNRLKGVSLMDPARSCADSVDAKLEDITYRIAAVLEELDNRGVL